jgi:hypothetical protein
MAWAHGTYHLMTAGGATSQKGKWVIQTDIWNTDAPE